jgi:hypothetical protein
VRRPTVRLLRQKLQQRIVRQIPHVESTADR